MAYNCQSYWQKFGGTFFMAHCVHCHALCQHGQCHLIWLALFILSYTTFNHSTICVSAEYSNFIAAMWAMSYSLLISQYWSQTPIFWNRQLFTQYHSFCTQPWFYLWWTSYILWSDLVLFSYPRAPLYPSLPRFYYIQYHRCLCCPL